MTRLSPYNRLEREFDRKVAILQRRCPHTKTQWLEHWWAFGHSSGYRVLVRRLRPGNYRDGHYERVRPPTKKVLRQWLPEAQIKTTNAGYALVAIYKEASTTI